MDIGFVILHYKTINDTESCVDSIRKKCVGINYAIIIVDNASPDNTYNDLQKLYNNSSDVVLIHNEKNEGFAKGNNVGIRYLRDKFDPDYICVMNSDIVLLDNNLLQHLEYAYKKYTFSVLGPLVFQPNGICKSNPLKVNVDLKEIRRCRKELIWERRFLRMNIYIVWKLFSKIKHKKSFDSNNYGYPLFLKVSEDVVLHGCCMFFSKKYFEKFPGFDERTFLYYEEDILYTHCKNNSLTMLYYPYISVLHNQGGSTNTDKNEKRKMLFVTDQCMKSLNVLEIIYNDYQNNKN